MAGRKPITTKKKQKKSPPHPSSRRGISSPTRSSTQPTSATKKVKTKARHTNKKKSVVIFSQQKNRFALLFQHSFSLYQNLEKKIQEFSSAYEHQEKKIVNFIKDKIDKSDQIIDKNLLKIATQITRHAADLQAKFVQPATQPKKKKTTKKGKVVTIKIRKKKSVLEKKLQKLSKQLNRFWRKVGRGTRNTLRFLKKETIDPFIYVFRFHPFLTFGSILLSLIILGSSYTVYDIVFKDLPSVTEIAQRKQILTTRILDRNGKLLYQIYKDQNRTLIPLSQVPIYMREATISIEDRDFYTNRGVSVRGILRAFTNNLRGNQIEGGSTITQQLIKNTLLSKERTIKRKAREIILAFIMEDTYSKDQILEMYFNEVPYGGSTYGVEQAAQTYFGIPARELDLAQAAFLAGLPAAPSAYSPFGATPDYAYQRQHEVLHRMVEDHYITQAQADQASKESLKFKPDTTDIRAPHFVMYVRSLLSQQYGEDELTQGGLEIRTTLDLDAQDQAQKAVTDEVNNLNRLHITNGAALVTNPQTGEVLAMVGSKNYFDFQHDGEVNVTIRPRQPGSSIKPVTYSVAFEHGESPSTTIVDEPTTFNIPGSPPYTPRNYDGRFHGNVTIREALGSSYNIPAVKTLASIGVSNMIDQAQKMGVTTWDDRKRFGLSLTLGGGEVMMTEMAQIYGTFATYGNTVPLNPILEVKDSNRQVLYHNSCALGHTGCPENRTLDAKVAYEITDILKDNNARTPAFGPRSLLYIPNQEVAVKTGTTNNLKDNWAFGYTQNRVVSVWVGNNDGSPMSYVASGITGASPIWNTIMRQQLDAAHPNVFPLPDGLVRVTVCTITNTLPCQGCPSVREDIFIKGSEPTQACNPAYFKPQPTPAPNGQSGDKILNGVSVGQ